MSIRVLRKRQRTKTTNRPTPPLTFTLRASVPIGAGTHARYALGVAEGRIDRDAWAQLVTDLIRTETRGKKAPFARLVGVDTRTLDRWLHGEVDVREESVRAVARSLGRAPMELLVAVGFYRPEEVVGGHGIEASKLDPDLLIIMRRLADPNVSDAEKATIRATLRYLAELADRDDPGEQRRTA